jgi:uncharacterized protein YodC (DUF2158 family)
MWPFKKKEEPKEEINYDTDVFYVGLVVKLKSGGPLMTVCKHYLNGILCCYFNSNTDRIETLHVINPAVLDIVKESHGTTKR